MSPILVRPVREQLEHDRVIRLLQAKYKRKFDVAINPGQSQLAPVGAGPSAWYPDLVLHTNERGRRLVGVVEVETAESVNNLEAMSQWAAFSRQRADFHLYVPASAIDVTRRLCTEIGIEVTEIWAYHSVGDQFRFVLVQRAPGAPVDKAPPKAPKAAPKAAAAPAKPVGLKAAAAKAANGKTASSGKPATADKAAANGKAAPNGTNGKTVANGKAAAKPAPATKPAPIAKLAPVAKSAPAPKAAPGGKVVAKAPKAAEKPAKVAGKAKKPVGSGAGARPAAKGSARR